MNLEPRHPHFRLTVMRLPRALGVSIGAAVLIAGCGSSSSGGPVGKEPPIGVIPPHGTGAGSQGLRGFEVASTSCHFQAATTAGATPVATSAVSSLILCPLMSPNGKAKRVIVNRINAHFDPIVRALADPDQPPPATPQPCPMYADQPQLVLAVTSHGVFALAIPVDSCHHYQPAARAALTSARGTATPMSVPGGAS
jgi:hypothetical protein